MDNVHSFPMTPEATIKAARAQIIARTKAAASLKGQHHGAMVGAYTKQACTATVHTTHKTTVAVTGYSTGFARGFVDAWKAA